MTALAKLRDQITIARQTGNFVVLTADEAQAVVDEAEGPKFGVIKAGSMGIEEARELFAGKAGGVVSGPPYESDDEHA